MKMAIYAANNLKVCRQKVTIKVVTMWTWSQSCLKIVPKLSQNGPKVFSRLSQGCPKVAIDVSTRAHCSRKVCEIDP